MDKFDSNENKQLFSNYICKPQTQKPLRDEISDLNVNMNFPHTPYVP